MYPYLLASVLLTGAMPNKLFKDLKKSQGKAPVVKKIEPKKGTKPAAAKPEEPAKPAGAAPTTDTPAPEPEEPPLTAPPKPKESQLEITPVAPASQPAVDPETSVKLRGLEERVNELKEKIFRSKARLVLLQEAVLHGTITGARAVLVHKNEMSGSFKLSLATNGGMAGRIADSVLFGLGIGYLDEYPSIIAAITKDEVDEAIRKYIHPDVATTVIAGTFE